jgi:hypothetical protein
MSLKQGELERYRQRQPISFQRRTNTSQREAPAAMCKHFMNDILNKSMVLVLNRNWQAVNVRSL